MSTEPTCIQTVNLFLFSYCVKAHNSGVRTPSLKLQHDQNFETSIFVLTGLESLQTYIEIISCVESCRHKLLYWLKVKLTSIYSNNRFANICGLGDVILVNNNFRCKDYQRSSNHTFRNFWKQNFIAFCGWIKLCNGRTVQTVVGQVRQCTSKVKHIKTFVVIKLNLFCIASISGKTSLFL